MSKASSQAEKVFAYIDGANLHKAMKDLGWQLDYARFRVWLQDKFGVDRAYLFLGMIPKYKDLYTSLQEAGFTLVFKDVVYDGQGKAKGNCDADLVLAATRDYYEGAYKTSILVTSDGDYASLASFLLEHDALSGIISPGMSRQCSILLKRTSAKILYLNDQRNKLQVSK